MVPVVCDGKTIIQLDPSLGEACKDIMDRRKNLPFKDFQAFVETVGFSLAESEGSHFNYKHSTHMCGLPYGDKISIQEVKRKAKPYQVQQVVRFVHEAKPKG